MALILFTDTDTDIGNKVAKEYGFHLVSMPYSIDGETFYPCVSYDEFGPKEVKEYYDRLRSGVIPTTSAVTKEKFIEYFEPHFANGDDIFFVHFSRQLSGAFDNMDQALAELRVKYPERKFYELDTKAVTTLAYLIVREVGDLFKAGKTPEEVLEWGKTEIDHYTGYLFVDNITFFRRSGRVKGLAAAMGTLVGIRPIIYFDTEGKMVNIGKAVGRNKAIDYLMDKMKTLGDDVKNHRIVIGHTDALPIVDILKQRIESEYGTGLNIEVVPANPTLGAHSGPDGVCIAFHSTGR